MRTTPFAVLLFAALSLPVFAGTHKVPSEYPVATVRIPDDWKTDEIDGRIEATSSDGEVYLAIEETESDSIKECADEVLKYLKRKRVTVTDNSMKQEERKQGAMDVIDISWDGKSENGPAKVNLTIVAVTKTHGLLVTYWTSPAGKKKHAETLAGIANSITQV
jgi:hypothetical protein